MRRKYFGFTIIELLVVITIIGILATLVTMNVAGARHRANYTKALSEIDSIAKAAKLYREETKAWPADVGRNTLPTEAIFAQYMVTWPASPCANYVYDWENWPAQGHIIRVSLRNLIESGFVVYFYCLSEGTTDDCKGPTDLRDQGSLPIESLSDKKITCKELL